MRRARTVANHQDKTVPDLLHEILEPAIAKLYRSVVAEMAREAESKKKHG